jgi:hypothetical protein
VIDAINQPPVVDIPPPPEQHITPGYRNYPALLRDAGSVESRTCGSTSWPSGS